MTSFPLPAPQYGYLVRAGSVGRLFKDPAEAQRHARTSGGAIRTVEAARHLDPEAMIRWLETGEAEVAIPETSTSDTTKARMPEDTFQNRIEFAKSELKANPEISPSDLKRKGADLGLNIYPLIIGKARTALGLSKPRPEPRRIAQGSPARRTAAPATMTGLPAADALMSFAREFDELKSEVERYRAAIQRIREAVSKL